MQSKALIIALTISLFQREQAMSQTSAVVSKPELKTACDCKEAIPLTIAKSTHYGPTEAPRSFGKVQEISTTDKDSELSFQEEHNSAWYLLSMKMDGSLAFTIVPTDTTN